MSKWKRVWVGVKGSKPKRWKRGWKKVTPLVLTKQQWGGRPAKGVETNPWNSVKMCVHHTAGPSPLLPTRGAAEVAVRKTQDMHMDANGWKDVGYNYLISNGIIFVGRGFEVVGAGAATKTKQWNRGWCHVAFVGDYRYKKLSEKDIHAYRYLRQMLRENGVHISDTKRHSDLMATACPTDNVGKPLGI